jgi:Fe-S-cluster containining protein
MLYIPVPLFNKMNIVESPCIKYGCDKCCRETVMPLSNEDITRIKALGYTGFIDNSSTWPKLMNIDGACYFLEKGRCTIYNNRPEGCKLYPIVMNVDGDQVGIDDDCRYSEEFEIIGSKVSSILDLFDRLNIENKSK